MNAHGGILGRQVQLKIVDDASNPNQAVTNYQNLITRDHVDLVFGPFSSLLTGPAATVAKRYHYAFLEPAGGGPAVFALKLNNLFFVQPAPVVRCGDSFVRVLEDAAGVAAAEDGGVSVARRSVLVADRGCDAGAVREDGREDRLQDDLSRRDHRHDADHREGDLARSPT